MTFFNTLLRLWRFDSENYSGRSRGCQCLCLHAEDLPVPGNAVDTHRDECLPQTFVAGKQDRKIVIGEAAQKPFGRMGGPFGQHADPAPDEFGVKCFFLRVAELPKAAAARLGRLGGRRDRACGWPAFPPVPRRETRAGR